MSGIVGKALDKYLWNEYICIPELDKVQVFFLKVPCRSVDVNRCFGEEDPVSPAVRLILFDSVQLGFPLYL